jgi:two-component system response regulator DevR
LNVLIADDSELTLERMVAEISALTFVKGVWQAKDVNSTLEGIKQHKPDVVILDIKMPGGSGLDVLEEVKGWADSPIVIINTFYPYPQHRQKALSLGADYFFDKTQDFYETINTIRELEKRLLLRDKERDGIEKI